VKAGDPAQVVAILQRGVMDLQAELAAMPADVFGAYKSYVLKQKNMERVIEHSLQSDAALHTLEAACGAWFPTCFFERANSQTPAPGNQFPDPGPGN
jgi:hypothetical protein